ncbi:hypothetical protein L9F63_018174 [Diploptera punctata]|uniref:Uncharacterized protein n=1 Tax=Diploptera punctata TaxID=6984 RepID=A0AAD7ZXC9_DIPPU|nr:hypothetical protein L9F63_018174 [Diploptera punctata]
MLPLFFWRWTHIRNWTGMSSNNWDSRKFRNVSKTRQFRRRKFFVVYPSLLFFTSPSFVSQLYIRPRSFFNVQRRPGFKMQKRKKKHRNLDGIYSLK